MRCPQCGFEAAVGAAFCARCGTRIMMPRPEMKHEYALVRILPSWWHFTGKLAVSVGLIIFGLAIPSLARGDPSHAPVHNSAVTGAAVVALGVLVFIVTAIQRRHTAWSLTSERLIERRGFLTTRRRELELADVRSVEVDRRLLQRMRGLGDISVASAASAEFLIRLVDIPDPERIAEMLRQARAKRLA